MNSAIINEFKKQYMQDLLYKTYSNKDVIPSNKPFAILNKIDIEDIKLVIIGQDPYSTGVIEFNKFNLHYDGLAFSSSNTIKTPYSLKILNKWFINTASYFNHKGQISNDLSYLLDKKVILINVVWAVLYNKPLSLDYAEFYIFTAFLLNLIQNSNDRVVFLFLGKEAQRVSYIIDRERHFVFMEKHPAASRYREQKNLYNSDVLIQCLKKMKEPINLLKID